MSLRRKVDLIVAGSAVLTSILAFAHQPSPGSQDATGGRPAATRGSDWTIEIKPPGAIEVAHKGATVLSTATYFWGPKWSWAGPNLKWEPAGKGRWDLTGEVPDLKLRVTGTAHSTTPNVLQMDFLVRAERAMPDVIGGGWQWDLRLDSPSFQGRAADPELLPNNEGWSWRVGSGQTIALRFEGGAAKVYFERNRKDTIRTFMVADRIDPGTRHFRVNLELPEGARPQPPPQERYDPADLGRWSSGALAPDAAPVDLSFLNGDDRPAGRRGFVRADGDRAVFADGSTARFWGSNLVANALFSTPPRDVPRHAHRMAQLGYNLMRIHHHDSDWVVPNIFGREPAGTRSLDARSLDALDWWIKCFKDEGIYVWLDMHVGRTMKPGDVVADAPEEVAKAKGALGGLCYYNPGLQGLMKEFQHNYLNHLNRYTNLRYKDDPAVIGVLVTNENDLTHHMGNMMLPDYGFRAHNARWTKGYQAFAQAHGLPPGRVYQTWLPGPSKLYLSQAEHDFNRTMIADLRGIGVKAPIATTNLWGGDPLFSLAPLTDGDWIDAHVYGQAEELGRNAHDQGNYLAWIAMGQVEGKPLSITEWNVPPPNADRFTTPLAVASVACLQGWDAPMIFAYSVSAFPPEPGPDEWSTYHDPALTAIMPAAALLFRRGHVSPAKKTYCFRPDASAFFGRELTPNTSATIRTLAEQSKLTIGIPETPELPWLKPSRPSSDAIIVTDPDRDFLPRGQSFVRSDTGELTRDWEQGIRTIDTTRTQAVSGWIGGRTIETGDASFETLTKKAVIALTSVDDLPLSRSRFILVTAVARAVPSPGNRPPYLSEPVRARITLRTRTGDLELLSMGRDGRVAARPRLERRDGALTFELPAAGGTHWYVLKSRGGSSRGAGSDRSSRVQP